MLKDIYSLTSLKAYVYQQKSEEKVALMRMSDVRGGTQVKTTPIPFQSMQKVGRAGSHERELKCCGGVRVIEPWQLILEGRGILQRQLPRRTGELIPVLKSFLLQTVVATIMPCTSQQLITITLLEKVSQR